MYQTNLESNNFLRLSYKERRFRVSERRTPRRLDNKTKIAADRALRLARKVTRG